MNVGTRIKIAAISLSAAIALVASPATASPGEGASQDEIAAVEEILNSDSLREDSAVPLPPDTIDEYVEVESGLFVDPTSETYRVELREASFTIACTITAHYPHHSSGAGGMIFKSTVNCTGTGSHPPTATILVKGGLFLDYAINDDDTSNVDWNQVRSSNETRTVSVSGLNYTFYTPPLGTSGAHGRGFWMGTSTVTIVVPTGYKVGSDSSDIVYRVA